MKTRRLIILFAVVVVSFSASGCGYNTLTTKHENVKGKWAGVETQLQRRGDLLNNLAEAAKMAGVQEQEVFGQIAKARSQLLNATQQAPQGEGGDKSPEQKQAVIDAMKPYVSLYMGGMGAKDQNFHKQVFERMGYEKVAQEVQDLYLTGERDKATALIPDELVDDLHIIGTESEVRERAAEWAETGVTMLVLSLRTPADIHRVADVLA